MITAVDSNVLIDVFLSDAQYGRSSARALSACLSEGAVVISGVVLAEIMPLFSSKEDFLQAISVLSIQPVALSIKSFYHAAIAWMAYRQSGGGRNRLVADFLIGAHAQVECDRLLTRDRGFYRKYFTRLTVIQPQLH